MKEFLKKNKIPIAIIIVIFIIGGLIYLSENFPTGRISLGKVEISENPKYLYDNNFQSTKITLYGIGLGEDIKDKEDFKNKLKKSEELFINFYDSKITGIESYSIAIIKNKEGKEIGTFVVINNQVEGITLGQPIIEKLGIFEEGDITGRFGKPDKLDDYSSYDYPFLISKYYDYIDKGLSIHWMWPSIKERGEVETFLITHKNLEVFRKQMEEVFE